VGPTTGGIEWDDEPGEQADQVEPEPPLAGAALRRRRVLGALLALAAAAAVIGYAGRAHDATPSAAPATSRPAATPSRPLPSGFVVHLGDRNGTLRNDVEVVLPQLSDPPPCSAVRDTLSSCTVLTSVPPALQAALHSRFPHLRISTARTELLESQARRGSRGLWARRIVAAVGTRTLRIVISTLASTGGPAANSFDDGNRVIDFAQHSVGRFSVQVQATAPSGAADALAAVAALSTDRRLLAGT
jgi:hypothetical protein